MKRNKTSDEKVLVEEARRTVQNRPVRRPTQPEVMGNPAQNAAQNEARRVRSLARIGRVVNLVFAMVYLLLGLRLLVSVLAVSPGAAFAQWVLALTDPLLAPLGVLLPRLT